MTLTPRTPLALARVFVAVALAGIGGGIPAHARRHLVERGWLTELEFAEFYTLAQLAPGPNAVNLAAMIGMGLSGVRGAVGAVMGLLAPGLAVMLLVSALLLGRQAGLSPALEGALRGAACAALGVMLTAAVPLVRIGVGVRGGAALLLLTFVGLGVLRLSLLPTLLALTAVGLWLNRPAAHPAPTPPEERARG